MPSDSSNFKTAIMPDSQAPKKQPAPANSLEQQLRDHFEQLGYPQLQGIGCKVEGDTVKLTGQLDSFYLKQVVQSVAVKIAGSHSIENLIEVN